LPAIRQAFEFANQANLSTEELEDLEKREIFIHDQRNAIKLALRQGLEQGRQEGLEQGRQEGDRSAQTRIAQGLLPLLTDDAISQTTGLSLAKVQQLRSSAIASGL
jgi:predicted transposase/invertase (TIGR01784 family)